MKILYRTVPNLRLNERNITLIYINGRMDMPSAKFLIHEVSYGGRHGGRAAESTHRDRAVKIGELYRHLNTIGKRWNNALEIDIKMIIYSMLCWNGNGNKALEDYDYSPIKNDTMNSKIGIWFKFYNYMEQIGEFFDMVMTIKKVRYTPSYGMLGHLNNGIRMIDVWALKVKASPEKYTYHALTQFEYYHFQNELEKIDIVYAMIAYLMVETGLRISATLRVNIHVFRSYFRHINKGKSIDLKESPDKNDFIPMSYVNKGGFVKECDLPMRAIININQKYLSRIHGKRMKAHSDRYRQKEEYEEHAMWILSSGKVVKKHDVLAAFKKASEAIGFTVHRVTPHWMRHTFSTWFIMNYYRIQGIPFRNTNLTPDVTVMGLLAEKLGQASDKTALIYTRTAFKMMSVGTGHGPIMSFREFEKDKRAQEIVRYEAMDEFGNKFDPERFDVIKYAKSRTKVVDL